MYSSSFNIYKYIDLRVLSLSLTLSLTSERQWAIGLGNNDYRYILSIICLEENITIFDI